jgi:hypothetical protein
VPASLGPGLRTVSGAKRSLGKKLPSAFRAMTGESTNSQKMLLAVAIAEGTPVAEWASRTGVPERTAYHWAAQPEVRAEVEAIRRRALDEAIGRMAKRATWAVDGIIKLGENAASESVRRSRRSPMSALATRFELRGASAGSRPRRRHRLGRRARLLAAGRIELGPGDAGAAGRP